MRLNKLVNLFARRRSGIWILGGLAAVLDGVARVMRTPGKRGVEAPAPARTMGELGPSVSLRKDFYTIKRTQSELGFTFWVLQGHGRFASFELFDSWPEAMAAADSHLAAAREEALSNR